MTFPKPERSSVDFLNDSISGYEIFEIIFPGSKRSSVDFLKEVEIYAWSTNICKILGITQNTSTNEYLIVSDEFFFL